MNIISRSSFIAQTSASTLSGDFDVDLWSYESSHICLSSSNSSRVWNTFLDLYSNDIGSALATFCRIALTGLKWMHSILNQKSFHIYDEN
jgi:hypothetical protein